MINIFNRREILTTRSQDDFARVCSKLDAAGIEYKTRVFYARSHNRTRALPAMNMDSARQFYIYVHKDDEDAAIYHAR